MGRLKCKTNNFLCIGDLTSYITLQKRSLTPPSNVDFIELYTNIASVWANVQINNSTAPMSQTNTTENITHFFYIKYRADITIDNWILFGSNRYNIVELKDVDFQKNWLELSCVFKGNVAEESAKW